MVRPIRAENLAVTEVVVAVVVEAMPCGVAATTTQIRKAYIFLEFYRRPRGSMIEGMR